MHGTETMSPQTTTESDTIAAGIVEVIDAKELARRWSLPESWVRAQTRSSVEDPIPCLRFGKYVRFRWNSPELGQWLKRRQG